MDLLGPSTVDIESRCIIKASATVCSASEVAYLRSLILLLRGRDLGTRLLTSEPMLDTKMTMYTFILDRAESLSCSTNACTDRGLRKHVRECLAMSLWL